MGEWLLSRRDSTIDSSEVRTFESPGASPGREVPQVEILHGFVQHRPTVVNGTKDPVGYVLTNVYPTASSAKSKLR
jgi:hypothetical protein